MVTFFEWPAMLSRFLLVGLLLASLYAVTSWSRPTTIVYSQQAPVRINSQHLPNLIQVHPQIYSGGLPETEAAFQELQRHGIKTIISVDGMTPDVNSASQYDLRYVHLPHGYDGISPERVIELAQAFVELPKPIYVHCHHGKHRSPTAVAAGCVAAGMIPPQSAPAILKLAGNSPKYGGLHRVAQTALPLSAAQLHAAHAPWRAVQQVSHTECVRWFCSINYKMSLQRLSDSIGPVHS